MKHRKITILLAGLLLLTLVLSSACGNSSSNNTANNATNAPVATDSATDAPAATDNATAAPAATDAATDDLPFATVDFYMFNPIFPDLQMVNDAMNEYLKDKINMNVNMIIWGWDDYTTKLPTMLASGVDCGIQTFGILNYLTYASNGAFAPLDDLLQQYAPGTYALFDQDVWDCMTVNGAIRGIPSKKDNAFFMNLVYNSTMADALGIDMSNFHFKTALDWEALFTEVQQKRHEQMPQYDSYPVFWGTSIGDFPESFSISALTGWGNWTGCLNIPGIDQIAGYDDNTVFDLYETPEYREFCHMNWRLHQNGVLSYDLTDKDSMQFDGGVFAYDGWGAVYEAPDAYSEDFDVKLARADYFFADASSYNTAGLALSTNCANKPQAMKFLELLNTDPYVATMMRFGIEGQHYRIDDSGNMIIGDSPRNMGKDTSTYGYYSWYNPRVGNLTIVKAPESLTGPDNYLLKTMDQWTAEAHVSNAMGFVLNTDPITNELTAVNSVIGEYSDAYTGTLNTLADVDARLDEFIQKLKDNGVDKVIAETQSQYDAWRANK